MEQECFEGDEEGTVTTREGRWKCWQQLASLIPPSSRWPSTRHLGFQPCSDVLSYAPLREDGDEEDLNMMGRHRNASLMPHGQWQPVLGQARQHDGNGRLERMTEPSTRDPPRSSPSEGMARSSVLRLVPSKPEPACHITPADRRPRSWDNMCEAGGCRHYDMGACTGSSRLFYVCTKHLHCTLSSFLPLRTCPSSCASRSSRSRYATPCHTLPTLAIGNQKRGCQHK